MRDLANIEWELWRDLCSRLEEAGLVTQADLRSPVAENKTEGQKLIHAIKAWGEDRANDIARGTIIQLVKSEYVLTALREWGQAYQLLSKEAQ